MSTQFDVESVNSKKLNGALLSRSIASPLVLYPTVAAGLGVIAGALFGFSAVLLMLLIGGALVAVGGFTTEFAVRREANIKLILKEATEHMRHKRESLINALLQTIDEDSLPTAKKQLNDFRHKFDTYVDVLDDRFNPTELTFVRYMSVAEQVYLSALDNLQNAVTSSKVLQTTDIKELKQRLTKLGESVNDELERAALNERVSAFESTQKEIAELIVLNEQALATLDSVSAAVARTKVSKGLAESDIETAVNELSRMGAQLARYHKSL
jgi:hypothetical protein